MMKNLFKITMAVALLCAAPLAHAIEFGKYELSKLALDGSSGNKIFDICIQQGGNWHISGADQGWVEKWSRSGLPEEKFIFQAIHSQQGRMRSISIDEGVDQSIGDVAQPSYGYYQEVMAAGKSDAMEVELKYKGRCSSHQGKQVQAKKPETNVSSGAGAVSVGPWQVSPVYENGAFQFCGAGLNMDTEHDQLAFMDSSSDDDPWLLALSNPARFRVGSNVNVRYQFGINNEILPMKVVEPDMLVGALPDGWMDGFVFSGNGMKFQVWMANKTMIWHFSHTHEVMDAIGRCVDKGASTSKVAPQYAAPAPSNQRYQAAPRYGASTPRYGAPTQSNHGYQSTPRYGQYTAIYIDRNIVKNVIAEGRNVYVKLPSGSRVTVRKSTKNRAGYTNWSRGRQKITVGVSNANRKNNKKGYTYRINTSAKFIEYHVNGRLVLQLKRD